MAIITLTTDFGLRDWFVGTMKGVLLGIAPKARIVDITHEIAPGDVKAGAFALAAAFRFFPPGTVHLAVIDPGVGSDRDAIVVRTRDYHFVGPDNGLLSLAVAQNGRPKDIYRLENRRWFLRDVSRTFHGRDVFAPVAAHLSKGIPAAAMGSKLAGFQQLQLAAPARTPDGWTGLIVYIDRFGNGITNLPSDLSIFKEAAPLAVRVRRLRTALPVATCYSAVSKGKPLAVNGSSGFLEIAVNSGNASDILGLRVGDPVLIRRTGRF